MKKLPESLVKQLLQLQSELEDARDQARTFYDNESKAWRDSELGGDYSAWIESIEATIESLDKLPHSPS